MHEWRRACIRTCLIASALVTGAAAAKGQLQTRPTMVELASKAAAGRFILSNSGDAPVGAEVRVFAWSQPAGEDQLAPTQDIVLSPPIAKIAAGAEQVVRLIRTTPAAVAQDRTYRLVVDELPGEKINPGTAVSVRLRYVIPLFVRGESATAPDLHCWLTASVLACRNQGGQAAQLGRTRLDDAVGHYYALSSGLFGYVLPLSERHWTLDRSHLASISGNLRLETRLNGQPVSVLVARSP